MTMIRSTVNFIDTIQQLIYGDITENDTYEFTDFINDGYKFNYINYKHMHVHSIYIIISCYISVVFVYRTYVYMQVQIGATDYRKMTKYQLCCNALIFHEMNLTSL